MTTRKKLEALIREQDLDGETGKMWSLDSFMDAVEAIYTSTELEGATEDPALNQAVTTTGQFAALWNTKSEEQREEFLQGLKVDQMAASACFMKDHDGLQQQLDAALAKLQKITAYANDRAFHARGHLNTVNSGRIADDLFEILGFTRAPDQWVTQQSHPECIECEALVEAAIDHCNQTGGDSALLQSDHGQGHEVAVRRA